MFEGLSEPDHPGPSPAFTPEMDLDAQRPKECLRTTQPAGELPRGFWPACVSAQEHRARTYTQKLRSSSRPCHAVRHDLPHSSGYWVGVDYVLDRTPAVCLIGASERATRPERRFACRGPHRKV